MIDKKEVSECLPAKAESGKKRCAGAANGGESA